MSELVCEVCGKKDYGAVPSGHYYQCICGHHIGLNGEGLVEKEENTDMKDGESE